MGLSLVWNTKSRFLASTAFASAEVDAALKLKPYSSC